MPTKDPDKLKAKRSRWYQKHKERILHANANENADRVRNNHLKRKFGLTLVEWNKEFEKQGRKCASCGAVHPGSQYGWHTDHDHATGKFRGILCRACNIALGLVDDNLKHLRCLIEYLTRTGN